MTARTVLCALLLCACGPEVTVGQNRSRAPAVGGDSGLLAVRYDAGSATSIAAGHHGCAEPSSVDCDLWLARVEADAALSSIDLFGEGLRDAGAALWLLDEESRVIAGVATLGAGPRAVAVRFDGDRLAWSTDELSPALESTALALEGAPDGTLVAAGNELTPAGVSDGFVARLDTSGNVLGQRSLVGTGAADTEITSAVVTDRNQVFVAGLRRRGEGDALERLPVVVQLSSELEVWNSNTALGLDVVTGRATGILVEPGDEFLVCGSADERAFVARIDSQLALLASAFADDPDGAVEVRGCAATDDGGVVLVGAAGAAPWVAKFDRASLTPIWTRKPTPVTASLWAVTGVSGGRALAVGRDEPAGAPFAVHLEP